MAKLILVEDEVIIGETIKIHLEMSGHEVIEHFITGEEVVEYLHNDANTLPDLILFDINLAGKMSGIEAAEIISHSLDIPHIFLTGNGDIKNVNAAKETMPYGYILKPFDEKILTLTVDMALNRAQKEQHIKQLRTQLDSQNRLAELGETFGGLCHDLVSPLGVIHERTSLLLNQIQTKPDTEPKTIETKLSKISEATAHCLQMVKDCKHWINAQADETPSQLSVFELVKEAGDLCKVKIAKHHVILTLDDALKDINIQCQKVKILNVLVNLINNATDAIAELADRTIDISGKTADSHVYIYITDSGSGIPSEIQDQIFNALFTTKDANTGTGLGLSISKKMLEAQGGDLHLDTECDNTRFVIQIPVEAS